MAKKKATSRKNKSETVESFESSFESLKEIVSELENGNLTLGQSLEKYEQGISKLKQCQQALESVQKKIELLVDLDEHGNVITRPFDDTETISATDHVRRRSRVETGTIDDDLEDVDDRLDDEFSGELF